ncbi:MAG: nucleotidyl transferase AbiEii/AbiGii toxin family protein [Planctomycetes bacterium]|nr:nucleotidyl transferase AbiEii/AbiGii toxin family protein [Planctomycetota bacterium]
MTELPLQRLLLQVIEALDRLAIPYAIMGGFAVRTWGIPRPTYDADLAVAAGGTGLQRLLAALEGVGFTVPDEYRGGFLDSVGGMDKLKVTRFEEDTVWDVDLFLARGGLLQAAIARRRPVKLEGRSVSVMSPEDVILLKLLAFRRKDQVDVEEILKIAEGLDRAYLRAWAVRLGIADRLETFLREAPPG